MMVNYSFAAEGHVVSLGTLEFLQIQPQYNEPASTFLPDTWRAVLRANVLPTCHSEDI